MTFGWVVATQPIPLQDSAADPQDDQEKSKATDTKQQDTKGKASQGKSGSAAKDGGAKTTVPDRYKPVDLLAGDLNRTWGLFAAEEGVKLLDVWQPREFEGKKGVVCTGKLKGYLRTKAKHGDYKLDFQFRFPMDENGNSGVLLHVDGKDKIWPDGIQVQFHRPKAGSIFPSGNRKTPFTIGAQLPLHEVNKWNTCEIIVKDEQVYVTINGKKVGPLQECKPKSGYIALQSEGSEVHFRDLRLTQLRPPTAEKTKPETASSGKAEKQSPSGGDAEGT